MKRSDIESDADHNRSVLTFAGTPEAVKEAALAVSAKAIELIELNKHTGQHPRMGAVDVVPFIPISDVTMGECVDLAKKFAKNMLDGSRCQCIYTKKQPPAQTEGTLQMCERKN